MQAASTPVQSPVRHAVLSIPTLLGISLFDYLVANVTHEALGHGSACVAVGGKPLMVTSAWFNCGEGHVSAWGQRLVSAGGTFANLIIGAIALAALRAVPRDRSATWYAVWLFAAVNLFMGGGYLMTSPLFGFGDWGSFVEGLSPLMAWKVGLALIGAVLSMASLFALLRAIDPALGTDLAERRKRIRALAWIPYVAGGALLPLSALRNPLGVDYVVTSALSTFGGTFFLAWMPAWVKEAKRGARAHEELELRASAAWILAGALAVAIGVGILGHGITLGHK